MHPDRAKWTTRKERRAFLADVLHRVRGNVLVLGPGTALRTHFDVVGRALGGGRMEKRPIMQFCYSTDEKGRLGYAI